MYLGWKTLAEETSMDEDVTYKVNVSPSAQKTLSQTQVDTLIERELDSIDENPCSVRYSEISTEFGQFLVLIDTLNHEAYLCMRDEERWAEAMKQAVQNLNRL
jgi:hypothetical protein